LNALLAGIPHPDSDPLDRSSLPKTKFPCEFPNVRQTPNIL